MMQGTYLSALIVAGVFTFMPGRIMFEVFFEGPRPAVGVACAMAIVLGGSLLAWRGMARPAPVGGRPRGEPA